MFLSAFQLTLPPHWLPRANTHIYSQPIDVLLVRPKTPVLHLLARLRLAEFSGASCVTPQCEAKVAAPGHAVMPGVPGRCRVVGVGGGTVGLLIRLGSSDFFWLVIAVISQSVLQAHGAHRPPWLIC
ncbi:hypothetical protein DPEC_G00305020 [Dallia pectoralis]|uniref:Uncharacterized protein n=1 Tax=Dallia pectoralis TaxID=75939 RepID=A0ACC2FDM3_DALPE|nr:hypothetical protein DPEC_G00305020 [Dallia pectoralis]